MYDEEPWKMALVQYCAFVDRLWLWLDRLCTFGTSWLSLMSWQQMEHMESGAEPVGEKSQRDIKTDCSVKQISLWEAGASTKLILLKNIKVTLWSSIDQHGVKDGNPSLSILNQRVPQFTKSRLDLLSTGLSHGCAVKVTGNKQIKERVTAVIRWELCLFWPVRSDCRGITFCVYYPPLVKSKHSGLYFLWGANEWI